MNVPPPTGFHLPPRPGLVPLAPLTLADHFRGVWSVVAEHYRLLLPVAALAATATTVCAMTGPHAGETLVDRWPTGVADATLLLLLTVVIGAVATYLGLALSALVGRAAGRGALGQRLQPDEATHALRELARPLVRLTLLWEAMILGVVLVLSAVILVPLLPALTGRTDRDLLLVVGVLWTFVVAIVAVLVITWFYTRLYLAPTILALERTSSGAMLGARAALRRSWRLTAPNPWRVWGIYLLFALLFGAVTSVISAPVVVTMGVPDSVAITAFGAALSTLASLAVLPFQSAVPALTYLDQRLRHEGLGRQIAEELGM